MFGQNVCRLCGGENGIYLNIFDPLSETECLPKIEAVVPDVVILRHDSLSKLVCHRCIAKVKDFYAFKEKCIATQRLLKRQLPWMTDGDKIEEHVPIRRPRSPIVTYLGGPLAHPFGDPEPEILVLSDEEDISNTSLCENKQSVSKSPPMKRLKQNHQTGRVHFPPLWKQQGLTRPEIAINHASTPASAVSRTDSNFALSNGSETFGGKACQPTMFRPSLSSGKTDTFSCPSKILEHDIPENIDSHRGVTLVASPSTTTALAPINSNSERTNTLKGPPSTNVSAIVKKSKHSVKRARSSDKRPKPKSKKCQSLLGPSDVKRISELYPFVYPVKIFENAIMFTCKICNKMLPTEEEISKHDCMESEATEAATKNVGSWSHIKGVKESISQNEDSCHSSSSSVELVIPGNEPSSSTSVLKYLCNICGMQFHNMARLLKHQSSHA